MTAYAQAYCYTKDSYFLQEFLDQHNYCKEKFFDSQYKEWFERLEYDMLEKGVLEETGEYASTGGRKAKSKMCIRDSRIMGNME